jgi:hypothetical protein
MLAFPTVICSLTDLFLIDTMFSLSPSSRLLLKRLRLLQLRWKSLQ